MQRAKQRGSSPPPRPEPSGSPVQPGDAAGEAGRCACPRGCLGSGPGGPSAALPVSCGVGCAVGGAELPAPSEAVVVA